MPQHIHKYHRVDIGRKKPYWVMQCHGSTCHHYHPMKTKNSAPTLVGKSSLCNRCGQPFIMDRRSILQAYPTCEDCVRTPNNRKIQISSDPTEDFFKKLEANLMGDLDE